MSYSGYMFSAMALGTSFRLGGSIVEVESLGVAETVTSDGFTLVYFESEALSLHTKKETTAVERLYALLFVADSCVVRCISIEHAFPLKMLAKYEHERTDGACPLEVGACVQRLRRRFTVALRQLSYQIAYL